MTGARYRNFLPALRFLRPPWKKTCSLNSRGPYTRRFIANGMHSTTDVENILLDTIKATGPISYASYMQMCLSHPTAGYYMRPTHLIGSQGDFITSPEISQVFGELLGVWLLSQWMLTGGSRNIRLVELGPGRGTLMHDICRVFGQFPHSRSALKDIHLVDTSEPMRSLQKTKLASCTHENHWTLNWHDSVDRIPHDAGMFTLVIAHEFFDALPFHLLQKTEEGWHEVMIASDPDCTTPIVLKAAGQVAKRFRPVLSPTPTPSATLLARSSPRFLKLPVGSRVEVSPTAFKISRQISELLHDRDSDGTRSGGSALIVDYGGDKVYGNSFRAFKNHNLVDVFHRPGECDLTANVDFTYLQEATAGLAIPHGPVSQAIFLQRMGLKERVSILKAKAKDPARRAQIQQAADRLVDMTGMGAQYQIMALTGGPKATLTPEERWPFVTV